MAHNMSSGTSFSALQHLLQLAYSSDEVDQEIAARDLALLVAGTSFPPVSFGPLAHTLCRLIPSSNLEVATCSARAMKILVLDDALRPQARAAGVSAVLCAAVKQWEDQPGCLREILGTLQTLCWDKQYIREVLRGRIVTQLLDISLAVSVTNQEVSVLALAVLANLLSFCDTTAFASVTHDIPTLVEDFVQAMPKLLDLCQSSSTQEKPQRLYSAAAIANASTHPALSAALRAADGIRACEELDMQARTSSHILGSRFGECVQTALCHLRGQSWDWDRDRRPGGEDYDGGSSSSSSGSRPIMSTADSVSSAAKRYRFKWGTQPAMEIKCVPAERHRALLTWVLLVWACVVLYTVSPALFGRSSENGQGQGLVV